MTDLKSLTKKITRFRDARDWKRFHKPKDMALSLVLETAELLEHFQWKDGEEALAHVRKNREAVGDELADVLYWVLLLSYDLGIDLTKAAEKKLKKNALKYPVKKARGKHLKYRDLK